MKKSYSLSKLVIAGISLLPLSALAGKNSIAEFTPSEADKLGWRVVDDGVMGGLSKGKIQISEQGTLIFDGKLSLENNGGFSSLRTGGLDLDLSGAEGIRIRAKGDGRTYQVRFGTDARYRGMEVSFMAEFPTQKGEWSEVEIPFSEFKGTFRGMKLKDEVFDPAKISRVGILLADKDEGSFELEVDWIRSFGEKAGSNDLVKTALGDGRFNILAKALTEAKLVGVLQGDGPFTVFAPTDEAFKKLPKGTVEKLLKPENLEQLQRILKYHVLSGSVDLAGALSTKSAKTVLGDEVKIAFSNGRVRVNDASIVNADIRCSNGVIHVIDSVILPPEPANDLASVAERAGNFKTLLAAIEAAGLSEVLASDGPLTVLAPTDEAFAKLPKGTIKSLLKPENRDQLREILSLHAVQGKVSAGDALNARKAKAVNGGSLEFGINDGKFQVNGATIVSTDITADNGVIHVIDTVLLPSKKTEENKISKKAMSPIDQIEAAIEQGVPVFNSGDHGKCAEIYRDCILQIAGDKSVDAKVSGVLRTLVEQTEQLKSDTEKAWLLRSGLDHLYSALISQQ